MGPLLVYYVFNTHLLPLGCLALRTPTPPVTHKLGPEAEALQVPGNILRDPRKESRMERDWSSDVRVVWSQQLLHSYGSVSVCVGGIRGQPVPELSPQLVTGGRWTRTSRHRKVLIPKDNSVKACVGQ